MIRLLLASTLAVVSPMVWQPALGVAQVADARPDRGSDFNQADKHTDQPAVRQLRPNLPTIPATGKEFEPSQVVAIVGGEPVFVGDMLFEVNQLIARFMPQAPASIADRERRQLILKLVPKHVEQKLLLIDVRNGLPEGVKFDEVVESASKEFETAALDEMMKSAGVDSAIAFDAQLRAQGSSLRNLRRTWAVNQVVRYFLSEKIKANAEVSHQQLLDYYRQHQSEYEFKARVRWEQVMVRHDRFTSPTDAMQAIVEMGNKIVYGASLAAIAKKSSHGFRAADGGQHDWTTQGSLVLKELDKVLFSIPPGQLSDIIKTDQGFHIVRVIEREEAGRVDFLEAQVEIRKKLESEQRLEAFDNHLAKLRSTIPVEITPEFDSGEWHAQQRQAKATAAESEPIKNR